MSERILEAEVLPTLERLVVNGLGEKCVPLFYVIVPVPQALYRNEDARHRAELRAESVRMHGTESSFVNVAGAQASMPPYGDVLYVISTPQREHSERIAQALKDGFGQMPTSR